MKRIVAIALAGLALQAADAQNVIMRRPLPQGGATTAAAPAIPTGPKGAEAYSVRMVGAQVAAAGKLFIDAAGHTPGGDGDLVPAYLPSIPTSSFASRENWAWYAVGPRALFQLLVPDADVCRAINRDSNNGYGFNVVPGGQERGIDEGCYLNGGYGYIYVKWYTG